MRNDFCLIYRLIPPSNNPNKTTTGGGGGAGPAAGAAHGEGPHPAHPPRQPRTSYGGFVWIIVIVVAHCVGCGCLRTDFSLTSITQ